MTEEMHFCPNCGSTDVEPDFSNAAAVETYGGSPNQWKCNSCDYTGMMPEGDPEEDFDAQAEEEIEFKPDKDYNQVNVKFGGKYVKSMILYIVLPLILIYALIYLLNL